LPIPCSPQYGGNLENIIPVKNDITINFSDIRDLYTLGYIVDGQDIIYSLAGQTSHLESMTDPYTDLDINCRSQLSILQSCRKTNPDVGIIYASTRQIYGRAQYLPVDEKHPILPVDVNGINKYAAEMYYTLYPQLYNMRCVSLRLTNTYGPRQQLRGNKQGFTGIFIRKAILGEKISIFGNGLQRRDFNYVDDVVAALILAAQNQNACCGKVYNLGSLEIYNLLEFAHVLHGLCEFESQLRPFPPDQKIIDIGDYNSDFSRFNSLAGWKPQIGLEEGLARTVDYFKPRIEKYL
jgi:UDP-glucose 4-epimerase